MDFLFIHGNFPAQFRHLAPLLAKAGHRVIFLTNRQDADSHSIKGVTVHRYQTHRSASPETHKYLQSSEEAVLQGQAVLREISKLTASGFQPRFVITHGGMGIGLFIKDFLPRSIHIGYFEWYFSDRCADLILGSKACSFEERFAPIRDNRKDREDSRPFGTNTSIM